MLGQGDNKNRFSHSIDYLLVNLDLDMFLD